MFWNSKREAAGRADILCCLKPKENTDCLHRGNYNPERKGVLDSFFSEKLSPLLLHPIGKAVVLIAFVALVGSSLYSALKVRVSRSRLALACGEPSFLTKSAISRFLFR